MSFGGGLAKNAAAEVAAELRVMESLAGIDIRDDDEMSEDDPVKLAAVAAAEIESIASSAASMALEEARAEVERLKTEMYVMKIQEQAKTKPVKLTEKQILHNRIVGNQVFVGVVNAMQRMDACTLWWVVQWGNDYVNITTLTNVTSAKPWMWLTFRS
jgi:hypothetical protein